MREIPKATTPERFVDYILSDTDSLHVVVGPVVWHDSNPTEKYFIIATSEAGRGFRCDRLSIADDGDRLAVLAALFQRRPLVIHDCDDELYMARLCETLWPGERISKLRATLEAERASWSAPKH
jgi:hypothetical protein